MITYTIFDFLILIIGMLLIWKLTPEKYKLNNNVFSIISPFLEAVWVIVWIIYFVINKHHIGK